jgi:hypothetical protein
MDFNIAVSIMNLLRTLSEFVEQVCDGRDESHGYKHMQFVTVNSHKILQNEDSNSIEESTGKIFMYVSIVAMLHDVADHKYDKDGTLKNKVFEFVRDKVLFDEENALLVMKIIDHISYSKENEAIQSGKPIDFNAVLGNFGAYVRDIVSDADKLEALGEIGFGRCVEFTKDTYKKKHDKEISYELLKQEVIKHANEKLLRLKDEFMRTSYGKQLAISLHDELLEEINKM